MKSTKTAWAVTAVVILLCAVLGCNRSLAALRSQAAGQIVSRDDYCIRTDCEDMVNIARNLMTLSKMYVGDPNRQPIYAQLEDYCVQMDAAGFDVNKRVEAARCIRVLAEREMDSLEKQETLRTGHADYLAGFRTDLKSVVARMEKDPYNDAARAFNKIEGSFPANVLGFLVGPLGCFEF